MTTTMSRRMHDGIVAGMRDYLDGNQYYPQCRIAVPSADYLDGYHYGWSVALDASRAHDYSVRRIGGHGYPYRAQCPCGWQSNTYAAAHAAHTMAGEHVTVEAMEIINRANRARK